MRLSRRNSLKSLLGGAAALVVGKVEAKETVPASMSDPESYRSTDPVRYAEIRRLNAELDALLDRQPWRGTVGAMAPGEPLSGYQFQQMREFVVRGFVSQEEAHRQLWGGDEHEDVKEFRRMISSVDNYDHSRGGHVNLLLDGKPFVLKP